MISSVAKGFRCFALRDGATWVVKAEPPWLDGADWKDVFGEVEKLWPCEVPRLAASLPEPISLADVAMF